MTRNPTVRLATAPCVGSLLVAGILAVCDPAVAQDSGAEYYTLVAEKNVFRKLGWSKPDETPRYSVVLIALAPEPEPEPEPEAAAEIDFWAGILGTPSEPVEQAETEEAAEPVEPRKHRALITRNGSNESFYVEVGEKVQDLTVLAIEQGKVTLTSEGGEETEVTLDTGAGGFGGGGGGGGRRGGPRRGSPGPPSGGGGGNRGGMPANARAMMERFRNASPEERQEMRAQFRGGRGGGGRGGGRGRRGD